MTEKEYWNLVKIVGVDFDDAIRLYEKLKDKDRHTVVLTLYKEGRIAIWVYLNLIRCIVLKSY